VLKLIVLIFKIETAAYGLWNRSFLVRTVWWRCWPTFFNDASYRCEYM